MFNLGKSKNKIIEKMGMAHSALSEKRFTEAIREYDEILKLAPKNLGFQVGRAIILYESGEHEAAKKALQEIILSNRKNRKAVAAIDRIEYIERQSANPEFKKLNQEMRRILNAMWLEIDKKPLYEPSVFWSKICRFHELLLEKYGVEYCKRTVCHYYGTYFLYQWNDPQTKALIKDALAHFSFQPLWNDFVSPSDVGYHEHLYFPYYPIADSRSSFIHKLAVGSLWEFALRNDATGWLDRLEEKGVGNPIEIYRKGKRISQDLARSVLERNLMMEHGGWSDSDPITVMELGAGHGRLAEMMGRTTRCRYLIFDIPPALFVSQWYIQQMFPEEKIFTFRSFESYESICEELEQCRFAFFTPNQMEMLPDRSADLCININSLMEMKNEQIKNYIHQIDRLTKKLFYSQQYFDWTNTDDNIRMTKDKFIVGENWKVVYEGKSPFQEYFFIQVWKRNKAELSKK